MILFHMHQPLKMFLYMFLYGAKILFPSNMQKKDYVVSPFCYPVNMTNICTIYAGTYNSVFDFCAGRCRHNSESVVCIISLCIFSFTIFLCTLTWMWFIKLSLSDNYAFKNILNKWFKHLTLDSLVPSYILITISLPL